MEAPPSQPPDSGDSSDSSSAAEALSIHAMAGRRPRSRILVEPLLWTQLQLDLLRCSFTGPHLALPAPMKVEGYPSADGRLKKFQKYFFRDGKRKDRNGADDDREIAIRFLLGGGDTKDEYTCDGPLTYNASGFYFRLGGYRRIGLFCSEFSLSVDVGERYLVSIAAHIDHRSIVWLRERKMSRRSAQNKLRRLVSTEPLHDPYLVAVLIGLAQFQWALMGPERRKLASGVKPKLLYTDDSKDFMYLYSTKMSSAFIGMFEDPTFTPTAPQSLEIRITTFPIQPLETLRDRILTLLLEATSLEEAGKSNDVVVY